MCLLLLAWKIHPRYPLLLAANRDEHHARPTAPLDYWPDAPGVVAGRDLLAGGTWLAARADGRFAAVTNFRDESTGAVGLRSRGELVLRYFDSEAAPEEFTRQLAARQSQYAGFNLILGNHDQAWYASNRNEDFAQPLAPGLFALSNHRLGTPWPKVTQGLQALRRHVNSGAESVESLFESLLGQEPERTSDLPWPASSGPFIAQDGFGTRATTLLWRDDSRHANMEERRFGPGGAPIGSTRINLGPAGAGT
jgi:uncharacterized protein with NRDE domain